MSGVAEMMSAIGYEVSGSDLAPSPTTARLRALGIPVTTPHRADAVGAAEALVVSAAIPDDNAEVQEARHRGLPVVRRGVMLAALARDRTTVAVTGTHGKSTTSSMITLLLAGCGLDPSAVIGARVPGLGGNVRIGRGGHFVVEADESEPSLLALRSDVAVLTNLEPEHLEQYGSVSALEDTIVEFAHRVPETGTVVLCADDPGLRRLRGRLDRPVITYGLTSDDADVVGERPRLSADGGSCQVRYRDGDWTAAIELRLGVPGRHTLLNALAAFAVGRVLGLDPPRIVSALAAFDGVDRRFQLKGVAGGVHVVDDYAHHPTEIDAVLATARLQPRRRLVAVFQPHRYSRTARFLTSFARALAGFDVVVLTDVYPAGEAPRTGAGVEELAAALAERTDAPVHHAPTLDDAVTLTAALARDGDLVLTLGAGSIGAVGPRILDRIRQRLATGMPGGDG